MKNIRLSERALSAIENSIGLERLRKKSIPCSLGRIILTAQQCEYTVERPQGRIVCSRAGERLEFGANDEFHFLLSVRPIEENTAISVDYLLTSSAVLPRLSGEFLEWLRSMLQILPPLFRATISNELAWHPDDANPDSGAVLLADETLEQVRLVKPEFIMLPPRK